MTDPNRLVSMSRLTSTLVILALVLFSPIRTSGYVAGPFRTGHPRLDRSLPPSHATTRLGTATATDADLRVNALPSEYEGQDWSDALDGPRLSVQDPGAFRTVPDPRSIVPRSILLPYPLRC